MYVRKLLIRLRISDKGWHRPNRGTKLKLEKQEKDHLGKHASDRLGQCWKARGSMRRKWRQSEQMTRTDLVAGVKKKWQYNRWYEGKQVATSQKPDEIDTQSTEENTGEEQSLVQSKGLLGTVSGDCQPPRTDLQ